MIYVKDKVTNKLYDIYSIERTGDRTKFLVYDNGWRWYDSYSFIPLNYEESLKVAEGRIK